MHYRYKDENMSGIREKNRSIISELNRNKNGPFSISDAAEELHVSENKAAIILGYLARKGWLSRIKRGLYLPVPLGVVNPKEYKTSPWITANHVFSPCYIGGWSAAEHWHLTEQIFNSVVVFTTKITRSSMVKVKGTNFIIKRANESDFKAVKSVWIDNDKILVSDPIMTLVDILDDPSIGGGIRSSGDILINYYSSEYRNDKTMLAYIEEKNNKTLYKRLGYLIELFKLDSPDVLNACKKNISKGFTYLDPSIKSSGKINTKWNLRINAVLKDDNS